MAALLACLSVSASATGSKAAVAHEEEMPARIGSVDADRSWPVFVAAELAISPAGEISKELFHPAVTRILQNTLKEPIENGCIQVGEAFVQGTNTPRFDSLDSLVSNAEHVVLARITGSRAGFVHGVPGQLLRIVEIRSMKGDGAAGTGYFFLPVARIDVGGLPICKSDRRYGRVPTPGDEVLIFAESLREEAEELFFRLPNNGTGVIVVGAQGDPAEYPRLLREELSNQSGAAVLRRVEALMSRMRSGA